MVHGVPRRLPRRQPVYQYLRDEIVELVGAPVYELLVRQLRSRQKRTPLPHPAVRS